MVFRRWIMWVCATALVAGVVMRWVGMPLSGWVISVSAAVLAFAFVAPAMGGRMREDPRSPLGRAHWGD
ncbi:MAG: hypothetical protein H7Y33_02040 [Cytophagales bacterium]|nr:hypothetical protein [Rhizobacter sp.]